MIPLPIDARLPEIVAAVTARRSAVIVAQPGAGKTTRVPPALSALGNVAVLQPRRMAARSLARRVADERGWSVGREVGWQVRSDRSYSGATRILFMTEGILAARLQRDPLGQAFKVIVLDEFHERTIHADLALAMAREAWRARDDLSIVVMSATIDARAVSAFLNDAPVIDVEGRTHPLDVVYAAGVDAATASVAEIARGARGVLCFQPGVAEIRRTLTALASAAPGAPPFEALPLHGGLSPDEQDRVMRPGERPRVIVATNIAETSVTVPDITSVVDSGLQRVSRFDAARGLDVLLTERVTADAADQRAGRAGRVGPGRVVRLWNTADRLRPHREPEIARVDLAPAVLAILAWGGDPRTIAWLDAPPPQAVDSAFALLERLGAVDGARRLTPLGDRMRVLPLHPRLARILIDANGAFEAAAACAVLSEPQTPAVRRGAAGVAASCDLLPIIDAWHDTPAAMRRHADELMRLANGSGHVDESALRHALFAGFADRLARRRAPRQHDLLMASGTGARQSADSGVVDADFLVCLDVQATAAGPIVRLASAVDRAWIAPNRHAVEHALTGDGSVRAERVAYFDAVPLAAHVVEADREAKASMLRDAWLEAAGGDEALQRLLRRLAHAGVGVDLRALAESEAMRADRAGDIDVRRALPHADVVALETRAPSALLLPSGRRATLDYREGGAIVASAKLQELFGLVETPRIGGTPVTFELLAPNGRPVQITNDLASFWRQGYAEVRKELRARYPRHPWPEDPYGATPTARAKPRGR